MASIACNPKAWLRTQDAEHIPILATRKALPYMVARQGKA